MRIPKTLLAALLAFMGAWVSPALSFERTGVVVDTMTAGLYTYLEVDAASGRYWAAAPKMKLAVGDQVDVAPGSEMKGFFSPSLNRTFESIIFTSSVKVIGKGSPTAKAPPAKKDAPTAAPAEEFTTVAQLYADRESLKGKRITVRGKVVKFNSGIMGKNFLHLQDGTGDKGTNDLTVTTQQAVRVGDQVIVTGTVNTDKNFGAGYSYDLILEEATVQPE